MKRLLYSYKDGYTTEYEEYLVEDGEVVANMGPHSALVLGMRNEEDHDWLYILQNGYGPANSEFCKEDTNRLIVK